MLTSTVAESCKYTAHYEKKSNDNNYDKGSSKTSSFFAFVCTGGGSGLSRNVWAGVRSYFIRKTNHWLLSIASIEGCVEILHKSLAKNKVVDIAVFLGDDTQVAIGFLITKIDFRE